MYQYFTSHLQKTDALEAMNRRATNTLYYIISIQHTFLGRLTLHIGGEMEKGVRLYFLLEVTGSGKQHGYHVFGVIPSLSHNYLSTYF